MGRLLMNVSSSPDIDINTHDGDEVYIPQEHLQGTHLKATH